MMRFLMALIVMSGLLVVAVPAANACDVADPTGATTTCVTQTETGYGDQTCQDRGNHRETIAATTGVDDVVSVRVRQDAGCHHGDYQYESDSVHVGVDLDEHGEVRAGRSTYQSDNLEWCTIFVAAEHDATGYQSVSRSCLM